MDDSQGHLQEILAEHVLPPEQVGLGCSYHLVSWPLLFASSQYHKM